MPLSTVEQCVDTGDTAEQHDNAEDTISTLQSDLGSIVNSSLLSDVTVLTGGGSQLRAHGCILAARCPGFRQAVLAEPVAPKVLDLSEFPRELVLLFLKQVYTAAVEESSRKELHAIAELYEHYRMRVS